MARPPTAYLWRELRRHASTGSVNPIRRGLRALIWQHIKLETTISGRHTLGALMRASGVIWGDGDV